VKPDPRQRRRARLAARFMPRFALADKDERQVGKRREIAAGANRSAGGYDRVDAAVHERDEQFERLNAYAGESLGEHVGPERHHRAHDRHWQRLPDAGGVTAKQVELQLGERLRRNGDLGEVAESRINAVRRRVAPRKLLDHHSRGLHARPRRARQCDRREVVDDRHEPIEGE
jgi:hypothetical protein